MLSLLFPPSLLLFNTAGTYLRYPDALSHLWSLCPSTLIPALFLILTLSPTMAWASPASTCLSSPSSTSFSSAPSISASIPLHTSFARCSASLSPAALNSLCSWCRLTPEKILEHPGFLLRRLEPFHCTGRPSSVKVDAGVSAMLCGQRAPRWWNQESRTISRGEVRGLTGR